MRGLILSALALRAFSSMQNVGYLFGKASERLELFSLQVLPGLAEEASIWLQVTAGISLSQTQSRPTRE